MVVGEQGGEAPSATVVAEQGAEALLAMGLVARMAETRVEASLAARMAAMRAVSSVEAQAVVAKAVLQAVEALMEVARAAVGATLVVAAMEGGGAALHRSCTIRQGSVCKTTRRAV